MRDEMLQVQSAVSVQEVHQKLINQNEAVLLDVRSPAEFSGAHAPGSILRPIAELNPTALMAQPEIKDKWVYLMCQSGQRARRALSLFEQAGFRCCTVVEGGLDAWIAAGLPVVRGRTRVLPLMRQVQIVVGLMSAGGSALALGVNAWFALIPLVLGAGLVLAGVTGICGLALLLAQMPWNQKADCGSGSCCGGND
jgi:rhodanese-related sulfurtransferase